MQIGDDTVDVH